MTQPSPTEKMDFGGSEGGGPFLALYDDMGMKQSLAKKTKLCCFLALVIYNSTPSTKKIGFRGVWGLLTWHFNSSR